MIKQKQQLFFILFFLSFIAMLFCYRMGYSMYVEGCFVGVVQSPAEARMITDMLYADSVSTLPETDLHFRFLSSENLTPASALLENAQKAAGIEIKFITETVAIPYPSTTVSDDSLPRGEEQITTPGAEGSKIVVKKVVRQNGDVLREEILSDTVTVAPVPQTVVVGTKTTPEGVGTGVFSLPLHTISVSSGFGPRWNRQHEGIDFAADGGTEILAADAGIVTYSGEVTGYGNLIIINHQNSFTTYYAHCSALYQKEGAVVKKGQVIGAVGSTGNSTGPHLHFEIRQDDVPKNPLDFLPSFT